MGRIQSSIGLITGTDIAGTVDQLIAISARPRDRLVSRTNGLQQEQQAISELTASVIGVQLAGNNLSTASTFRSKTATSSDVDSLSASAGSGASPATHTVRSLRKAATHRITSLQRYASADEALGFTGSLKIHPDGGLIDGSADLAGLNGGRGVEAGVIRITDRAGQSAEIDLTEARTFNDVIDAINDAEIDVRATTVGGAIKLVDQSGSVAANLRVEQIGSEETAADLGLWGIDTASNEATGFELELPDGVDALRGVALADLNGGAGIGPLTNLDITLSDGSSASVDLSGATTTSEVLDRIDDAGLSLIARLNDARNGFQIRDVSGGTGTFTISSSDTTADDIGLAISTTDDIAVGTNLNRQTVFNETLLADLNGGAGIDDGSFLITDSAGEVGAVNLAVEDVSTVGELIDAINNLSVGVTASLNDAGDGIAIVDTAGGASTLVIEDTGSGTTAADLAIAGSATVQTVGGNSVSALVGTQAAIVEVEADDTLSTLAAKISENGRYAEASVDRNEDGSFSLGLRSNRGGAAGRIAVNVSGFDLDLRSTSRGEDALIAVSTDGGVERFLTSTDGVFELDAEGAEASLVTSTSPLSDLAGGAVSGSFTITDSNGQTSAINTTVEQISTVGELVDAINALGIGVSASISEDGNGISVVDTAQGSDTLTITDVGNGIAASQLGLAGEATSQTIGGNNVSAIIGTGAATGETSTSGLVLTLKDISETPITVTVAENPDSAVSAAETFVDQFNLLIDKLDSLTFFNADTDEVGLLFGSSEALRIRNGYSRLLSGSIAGAGNIKSAGQVGIRFNDQGKLDFNSAKFKEALESGAADVESFFTTETSGLADRLSGLADRLAGIDGGMLLNRSETLNSQIEFNSVRIDTLSDKLEAERERLLLRFYKTEEAIAKIQSNQSAIDQIQPVTIPT